MRVLLLLLMCLVACLQCTSTIDPTFHPGYQCVDSPNGLVGWWDMTPVGSLVRNLVGDESASFSGAARSVEGKIGTAWSISSRDHVLSVGSSAPLKLTTAMTAMAWVKPTRSTLAGHSSAISKWKVRETLSTSHFEAFDITTATNPESVGFHGALFDGRYVYYIPHSNSGVFHANFVRYDTTKPFGEKTSWEAYRPGSLPDYGGYIAAAFDGRYAYFAPGAYNITTSRTLRFDTRLSFSDPAAWNSFDANKIEGRDTYGFYGGTYDGRYVYFVPRENLAGAHANVLRYDTQADFESAESWQTYDPLGSKNGFIGAVFDGRYLYLVPGVAGNPVSYNGLVVRFDTQGEFKSSASWKRFNAEEKVGLVYKGFFGGTFDGRYVYFSPQFDGSYHGNALRLDTQGDFESASSWKGYPAGSTGTGTRGYSGAVFDGRFVHFVPRYNGTEYHGRMLRYDTFGGFDTGSSWTAVDAGSTPITPSGATIGFVGGTFDGRYVYFSPYRNGSSYHGKALRYDTTGNDASFSLRTSGPFAGSGLGHSPLGPSFTINGETGVATAASIQQLSGDWHLLTGTYDSNEVLLYVDGELISRRSYTAPIVTNETSLILGGHSASGAAFDGSLDEVQYFGRALSESEVRAFHTAGPLGICR